MADASGALGEREIAGTWVNPRGAAKKLVSAVAGGQVGGAAGSFASQQIASGSSAVVMQTAARSDVVQAELGSGKLACPVTITFSDGARWEFDVPRAGKSAAQRVVTSLGG
jgi:hypothetical protein